MRISFLVPHLQLYGGIRRILELSNNLVDFGHEVFIFHSDGSACDWMSSKASILSVNDFLKFDHEHLIFIFQDQRQLFKEAKAKYKYYYNLNLFNKKNLKIPLFLLKYFDKNSFAIKKSLLIKNCDLIANCTDTKDWLKNNLKLNCEVVFGGVNRNIFSPRNINRLDTRIKIICLGSHKFWKGTKIIEDAVEIVKQDFPDVYLEKYFGKGLTQEQLGVAYAESDIFVDAQIYAGWNNPIAEAMASGVPVVCTDIGPNKDIAINNKTALMVEAGDSQAMASAIKRLLIDDNLRKYIINNALEIIDSFTWSSAAKKMESILLNREKNYGKS